jgi:hypothetical protein
MNMTEETPRASQRATLLRYAEHLKSSGDEAATGVANCIDDLVAIVDGYDVAVMLLNKYSNVLSHEDRNELFKILPIKCLGMLDLYTLVRTAGDIDPDAWLDALPRSPRPVQPGVILPFNRPAIP